jgi:hypothetical protein
MKSGDNTIMKIEMGRKYSMVIGSFSPASGLQEASP